MYEFWRDTLLHLRGEKHMRLRRLVNAAFSVKTIGSYRGQLRSDVEALARSLPADTTFDFAHFYADAPPIRIIYSILDIPECKVLPQVMHMIKAEGPITRRTPHAICGPESIPIWYRAS
jgi:cytochrome P450